MRILLVEDYKPLQRSLAQGLREAGFALDVTGDGVEGLWYARANPYDAVILDLMLPGLDGLEILRRLRAESVDIPVLILTARDTVADRVAGLDAGADDYLIKPFAFDELLARIRALLRRNGDHRNPCIEVADLHIDPAARRVRRADADIELTRREYALLEYLARRVDEVVSREDIWEHIYEFNATASSNVVDVYIGYLRRKLEAPGLPPLIHTVRGHGYRLGAHP